MKHSEELEPKLRSLLGSNNNRKKGTKGLRKLHNRIHRRKLKENPEFDITLFKKRVGWEF